MGRPNLMEQFGIEVALDPEQLVDNLAGTPPAFNEDAYSSPDMVVEEHRVAMEQLDEACVLFEALHNAGGINQMYAVALEDIDGYRRRAPLETYTPNLTDKNYQVSMEGLFGAIGRGISKFWEMVKSFFRWLFRLDRKSKAQKLQEDIANTDKIIKESTERLKESLNKIAEQNRSNAAQAVKDLRENMAKSELSKIRDKYASTKLLTDNLATWKSIDDIIKDYGAFEKKYANDDPTKAKAAGDIVRKAQALKERVGRCFTVPEGKPNQFERASNTLRANKSGKVIGTMSAIRGGIERCTRRMTAAHLISYYFTPDHLPTDLITTEVKKLGEDIKAYLLAMEEMVEPFDINGVGSSSTTELFSPRYEREAMAFAEKVKVMLMQYQDGWAAIAKKHTAWEQWLKKNTTAAEAIVKQLEENKDVTPEIRAAWSKALADERAAITDGIKAVTKAISLDNTIMDGVASVGETVHIISDMLRLKLALAVSW